MDGENEPHFETDAARGGSSPNIVRWILIVSLFAAIALLSIIWITGAATQSDAEDEVSVDALGTERAREVEGTDSIVGENADELGADYQGAPVAAYAIESHFDIQYDYNPSTGERVNVIVDWSGAGGAARRLGDGYRVEARIVLWEAPDVLRVPNGSLFRNGDSWAVFGVENERARLLAVELGQRSQDDAQILSGLSAGQAVVLHPPDILDGGASVRVRTADD